MLFNPNQFHKVNEKKALHKVGKQWAVVSLSALTLTGGYYSLHTNVKADTTKSLTTVKNNSQDEDSNSTLYHSQSQDQNSNSLPHRNQSQDNSNQQNQTTTDHTGIQTTVSNSKTSPALNSTNSTGTSHPSQSIVSSVSNSNKQADKSVNATQPARQNSNNGSNHSGNNLSLISNPPSTVTPASDDGTDHGTGYRLPLNADNPNNQTQAFLDQLQNTNPNLANQISDNHAQIVTNNVNQEGNNDPIAQFSLDYSKHIANRGYLLFNPQHLDQPMLATSGFLGTAEWNLVNYDPSNPQLQISSGQIDENNFDPNIASAIKKGIKNITLNNEIAGSNLMGYTTDSKGNRIKGFGTWGSAPYLLNAKNDVYIGSCKLNSNQMNDVLPQALNSVTFTAPGSDYFD